MRVTTHWGAILRCLSQNHIKSPSSGSFPPLPLPSSLLSPPSSLLPPPHPLLPEPAVQRSCPCFVFFRRAETDFFSGIFSA